MQPANEIWKDIEGYNGYYQVSNQGNVRSLDRYIEYKTKSGKTATCFYPSHIVKGFISGRGYTYVALNLNGKSKTFAKHRLVAAAFIPNPNNLPSVNHKDLNKQNNKDSNLEWCTQLENLRHAIKNYNAGSQRKAGLTRANKIYQYDSDWNLVAVYFGSGTVEKLLGIPANTTLERCRRKSNLSNGYYWRFAKDMEAQDA